MVRALVWLLLVCALPARAHVTSTGVATLDVSGSALTYRLTIVATEVEDAAGRIFHAAGEGDAAAAGRVGRFVRDYARFSMAGTACEPGQVAIRGSRAGDDKVVIEMALVCPQPGTTLLMRDDWPEVLGGHFKTVVSVRVEGRAAGECAFFEAAREATVEIGARGTGWLGFIALGAKHILGGPDHLLFLLALLATARGLWRMAGIVTGFTVAHSITLSLATLGLVDISPRIVEPLIAASIVWVAVENLVRAEGVRGRWLVATLFGLVHGLGFASALSDLGLPRDALVRALIGFNLGVEIGQVAFVALVMPLVVWLAKPGRLVLLPRVLSLLVAVAGTVWLVERVFFA